MAERLGVGVIGVGTIGRQHAANLASLVPRARLVAVADANPEAAQRVAAELAVPAWSTSAEELAANPDVEAVVIASSHFAHLEGILAAARHKKDVFCEKPMTISLEQADQAIAAVTEAGVRLQVGFMRRYDPAYVAAKRQIEAGSIGSPVLVKATHRNLSVPPSLTSGGAGAFVDSAVHDYDNARWFLDDEVVEVHAVAANVLGPGCRPDDLSLTTLRFARGGLATVETYAACGYAYDVRTEIAGTAGTLFVGQLRQTGCELATAAGVAHDTVRHWLARFGEAYQIELTDWVRRTLAGEPSPVTGADARAALAIALAATESAQTGHPIRFNSAAS
ncbi:MAG: Gfo/Idh/MocA family oxidoreductase [Chloroflexota bacterium]|nr:Gfo/Idh/MocA family oxidoreductase [Chloroflexota bacterium]